MEEDRQFSVSVSFFIAAAMESFCAVNTNKSEIIFKQLAYIQTIQFLQDLSYIHVSEHCNVGAGCVQVDCSLVSYPTYLEVQNEFISLSLSSPKGPSILSDSYIVCPICSWM
jgi:hypothetical protein